MGITCCIKRKYSPIDSGIGDLREDKYDGLDSMKIKAKPRVIYKNERWIYTIDNVNSLAIFNDCVYTQEVKSLQYAFFSEE